MSLEDAHLAIVRGRRYQRVIERTPTGQLVLPFLCLFHGRSIPVGVEDSSSVAAEEGQLVRGAAKLIDGDDGKSTTATSLPVDGDILGIGLWRMSAGYLRSDVGVC